MKVSILTIGTEVVTGEILNTNARWLSEQLEDLNFDVIRHLTALAMRIGNYHASSSLGLGIPEFSVVGMTRKLKMAAIKWKYLCNVVYLRAMRFQRLSPPTLLGSSSTA